MGFLKLTVFGRFAAQECVSNSVNEIWLKSQAWEDLSKKELRLKIEEPLCIRWGEAFLDPFVKAWTFWFFRWYLQYLGLLSDTFERFFFSLHFGRWHLTSPLSLSLRLHLICLLYHFGIKHLILYAWHNYDPNGYYCISHPSNISEKLTDPISFSLVDFIPMWDRNYAFFIIGCFWVM